MDIKLIRKKVQAGDYLVTDHADDERTKDELSLDEIEEARGKIKALVSIFGRETPVELDFLQVKKL